MSETLETSVGNLAVPAKEREQTQPLTRELIVATAIELLDRKGAEALNMRSIAGELGVRASALYRHVSGKSGILSGIRVVFAEAVSDPDGEFERLPWDEALRNWAYRYRAVFAEHPNAVSLLGVTPFTDEENTVDGYEAVIVGLTRAGWTGVEALDIVNVFDSFLLGSALDLAAEDEVLTAGTVTSAPVFSAAVSARRLRNLARGTSAAEATFEFGLDLLMTALCAQRDEQ